MTNAVEMGWDEVKNCDAGEQGLILVPVSLSNIKHTIRYRIHLKKLYSRVFRLVAKSYSVRATR